MFVWQGRWFQLQRPLVCDGVSLSLSHKQPHTNIEHKTTYLSLMENNITTHQQIKEYEKLDTAYLWIQRPTVATTTPQVKRRWARAKEEQRLGLFFPLTPLFWWLFGVWWVGEIHFRRVLCIHVHWFHLWHINLLNIRMSSEEELAVGEEENPTH